MELLQQFAVDLRQRLANLPWRTGSYLVDVMLGTEESNRLRFDLTPGEAAEKDPAIAACIAQQKSTWSGAKPKF